MPQELIDNMFLRNIENKTLRWVFKINGMEPITAKVETFLWTSEGIPVTLMLKPTRGKMVEVPWVAIQTIHLAS